MSVILQDLSAASVTRAIEVNLWEYWRLFGRLLLANLHDTSELLWVSTALPFPFLNGVVRTNLTPDTVDDATALRTWCSFTDQTDVSNALFELGIAIGFGTERVLRHYLGWLNGEPVATATELVWSS